MKSITYFTTYIFRLKKQVVCSLTESGNDLKRKNSNFFPPNGHVCSVNNQVGLYPDDSTCTKIERSLNTDTELNRHGKRIEISGVRRGPNEVY